MTSPRFDASTIAERRRDPDRIWLAPKCEPERAWAAPAPEDVCPECGEPWVEYVRADTLLTTAERAVKLEEALTAAQVQLQKAADQFAFYADEHAKKRTPVGDMNGATNMAWARSLAHTDHACRAALALLSEPKL